eukprot:1157565-Pelagomonas_calceolata.AAC.9
MQELGSGSDSLTAALAKARSSPIDVQECLAHGPAHDVPHSPGLALAQTPTCRSNSDPSQIPNFDLKSEILAEASFKLNEWDTQHCHMHKPDIALFATLYMFNQNILVQSS